MGEKTKLGQRVKDNVTGFVGLVTARCEYLQGDPRVEISALSDGRPVELWVLENRCEVVVE